MFSMIAWTRTASDVSDLPIVGYPLELLRDRSPFGATIRMRRLSFADFP
jgi:hypothetical protein